MGNLLNPAIATEGYGMSVDELRPVNAIKSSLGNLRILQNSKTNLTFVEKNIPFDNDQTLHGIKKCLEDLRKAQSVNYLQVRAVEVQDRRMVCSSSSVKIIVDYFEKTLEDVINAGKTEDFFYSEAKSWKLLFSLVQVLRFNLRNKIEGHFIHPRSIFYDKRRECWGLIHHGFFQENNFTEALAGNKHFCSPELYYQILSPNKKFLLVDSDRSNMFSLGLVILYMIYSLEEGLPFEDIYQKEQVSVDTFKIHLSVEELLNRGFSNLFVRILEDMLQDHEHKRLSSEKFISLLENYQISLETDNFKGQDQIYEEYCSLKGSNDNISIHNKFDDVFGEDAKDHVNISENFLNDDTMNNLKGKTVPFNNRFTNRQDSF